MDNLWIIYGYDWLVVFRLPLWKMMDFVSWDDELPNGQIQFMFQTTNHISSSSIIFKEIRMNWKVISRKFSEYMSSNHFSIGNSDPKLPTPTSGTPKKKTSATRPPHGVHTQLGGILWAKAVIVLDRSGGISCGKANAIWGWFNGWLVVLSLPFSIDYP